MNMGRKCIFRVVFNIQNRKRELGQIKVEISQELSFGGLGGDLVVLVKVEVKVRY